jgi:small GTP-binding protein
MASEPSDETSAKAVLIGSMAVGKTSLSNRFVSRFFDPCYQATVSVGYSVYKSVLTDHPVELQLWDTAGMERYTSLSPIYYRGAQAAIFVYDITNAQSANDLESWYDIFTDAIKTPFYGVVVANKIDLEPQTDTRVMEDWARGHKMGFVRTSAKMGDGVDDLFEMAVQGAFLVKNSGVFERKTPEAEEPPSRCC